MPWYKMNNKNKYVSCGIIDNKIKNNLFFTLSLREYTVWLQHKCDDCSYTWAQSSTKKCIVTLQALRFIQCCIYYIIKNYPCTPQTTVGLVCYSGTHYNL